MGRRPLGESKKAREGKGRKKGQRWEWKRQPRPGLIGSRDQPSSAVYKSWGSRAPCRLARAPPEQRPALSAARRGPPGPAPAPRRLQSRSRAEEQGREPAREASAAASGPSAMRRASRDYTKYLRGSEEMGSGGSGAPHEGPLHAAPPPAPPAPHQPAAASRSMFVAFLGLGLGQVVCSVALFLYFRAQVSARLPGGPPTSFLPHSWETESGRPARLPRSCI